MKICAVVALLVPVSRSFSHETVGQLHETISCAGASSAPPVSKPAGKFDSVTDDRVAVPLVEGKVVALEGQQCSGNSVAVRELVDCREQRTTNSTALAPRLDPDDV